MTEEDFKQTVENMLLLQQNNDHNFTILQRQIDSLQKQLDDLNDLKEMFRLPKPENKNRKYFDETD
jgi:flagellar biosynthesis/type III secretory pathway chaperone